MSPAIENVMVIVALAAALVFVAFRAWRSVFPKSGCGGGCSSCAGKQETSPTLVQLGEPEGGKRG